MDAADVANFWLRQQRIGPRFVGPVPGGRTFTSRLTSGLGGLEQRVAFGNEFFQLGGLHLMLRDDKPFQIAAFSRYDASLILGVR